MATPLYVIACYPWLGTQENQLSLEAGKVYQVLQQTENGWGRGNDLQGREGFFPFSFVKPCTDEEVLQITGNQPEPEPEPEPVPEPQPEPVKNNEPVETKPKPVTSKPELEKQSSQKDSSKVSRRVKSRSSKEEDKKTKKKTKAPSEGRREKRKRSKKTKDEVAPLARRGTVHVLQQFEQKSKSSEVSWATSRVSSVPIGNALVPPTELRGCLDTIRNYNEKISTAAANQDYSAGKKAMASFPSEMESCEWGIFEWHQILRSQWDARRENINTKLEETLSYLERLVKFQQARCFNPETVENDIQALISQIQKKELIEIPKASSTQLDECIERMRSKANLERENYAFIDKNAKFFDELTEDLSNAVCYMTLCHYFTNIFAHALIIESEPAKDTPGDLVGPLSQNLNELLRTAIGFNTINVPFASIISKMIASWGSLNTNISSLTSNTSLTELFAQQIAYYFVSTFRKQVQLLSVVGAFNFSEGIVVRMLSIIASGRLDLTRPVIEQLITSLSTTITVGHTKPVGGKTNVLIHGSAIITIVIPAEVETSAYVIALRKHYSSLFNGESVGDLGVSHYYKESAIIVRSGWECTEGSTSFKLTYPKHSFNEDFGYKNATSIMVELLKENGWTVQTDYVEKKDSDSKGFSIGGEEWTNLKEQVESQKQILTQQNSTINHLSQLIKTLQQQLQAEKLARNEMHQQLLSAINQLEVSKSTPTPNPTQVYPTTTQIPPSSALPSIPSRPPPSPITVHKEPQISENTGGFSRPTNPLPQVPQKPPQEYSRNVSDFNMPSTPLPPTPQQYNPTPPVAPYRSRPVPPTPTYEDVAPADEFDYGAMVEDLEELEDSETASASFELDEEEEEEE